MKRPIGPRHKHVMETKMGMPSAEMLELWECACGAWTLASASTKGTGLWQVSDVPKHIKDAIRGDR